jgi:hypothetical protein
MDMYHKMQIELCGVCFIFVQIETVLLLFLVSKIGLECDCSLVDV